MTFKNKLQNLETELSEAIVNSLGFNKTIKIDASKLGFEDTYLITTGSQESFEESNATLEWITYITSNKNLDSLGEFTSYMSSMFAEHPYLTTSIVDEIIKQNK